MPRSRDSSPLTSHAFRLAPHQDLKKGILAFSSKNRITAGCILTCVGSLERCHIRYANRKKGTRKKGHFEITSLTGTFSGTLGHFHLSLSDKKGKSFGGHLLDDNLVFTTAEIVIGELTDLNFHREHDPLTGFKELVVSPKPRRTRNRPTS